MYISALSLLFSLPLLSAEASAAELRVESESPTLLQLNGQVVGVAPMAISDLEPGEHVLELRSNLRAPELLRLVIDLGAEDLLVRLDPETQSATMLRTGQPNEGRVRLERVALSEAWDFAPAAPAPAAPVAAAAPAAAPPAEASQGSLRPGVLTRNIAVTAGGLTLGGLAVGNLMRGNAAYVVYMQAKEDNNPEYQQRIWEEQLVPARRLIALYGSGAAVLLGTSTWLWLRDDLYLSTTGQGLTLGGRW